MKRIHIVGCGPRSGTTLMFEMMVACFEIDHYTKHESRIFRWPSQDARIFMTKTPRDVMLVEQVLRIMKELYVIYMIRDPRDMIVSKHRKDPDRYWSGLRYWKTFSPAGKKLHDHPRVITIRYEDLVSEPDRIQNLIRERFPFLEKRIPFSEYHLRAKPSEDAVKALGSVRPISTGSIGNWRKHKGRIAAQIQVHGSITSALIGYGYEKDAAWEEELKEVKPDFSPGHYPENFSRKELRDLLCCQTARAWWAYIGHYRFFWYSKELVKRYFFRRI